MLKLGTKRVLGVTGNKSNCLGNQVGYNFNQIDSRPQNPPSGKCNDALPSKPPKSNNCN